MTTSILTAGQAVTVTAGAGAVGTLAMDLLWHNRYRRAGGEDGFFDWEFSTGTDNYEVAAAPAQVGKRLVEGLFDTKVEPNTAAFMTREARPHVDGGRGCR